MQIACVKQNAQHFLGHLTKQLQCRLLLKSSEIISKQKVRGKQSQSNPKGLSHPFRMRELRVFTVHNKIQ